MGYSIETLTADCYEGTSCLINKLNIRNDKQLAEFEKQVTFAKYLELEAHPINGAFDFQHYKAIHRFLFEDLYDWAGQVRTIDISKKGTVFTKAADIEKNAAACFKRLRHLHYFRGLCLDDYVTEFADFYNTTNLLHPFREGNGRTQRIFLQQLAQEAGYKISFLEMDSDDLMIATIYAAQGIPDQLIRLFKQHIVLL